MAIDDVWNVWNSSLQYPLTDNGKCVLCNVRSLILLTVAKKMRSVTALCLIYTTVHLIQTSDMMMTAQSINLVT